MPHIWINILLNVQDSKCTYFKQLAFPFEIYADFESILKGLKTNVKIIMLHILKNCNL